MASELLKVSLEDWEVLAIVEMREAFTKARREEQNPPLEPLSMEAWDNMYKGG